MSMIDTFAIINSILIFNPKYFNKKIIVIKTKKIGKKLDDKNKLPKVISKKIITLETINCFVFKEKYL